MLALLWLAYFSFGLVNGGIPPLVGSISEALHLSRSAMGSVLGAWPLVYIAVAIPAGALIDRFGLRRCLAAGLVLVAISGLLRAVAVNYATLFLAVAGLGLGGPFVSIGAPKLISVWFNRKDRARAMAAYMTASPLGRTMGLATANSVLMPLYQSSWRLTLATYGGVALMAGSLWWFLAKDAEPRGEGSEGSHKDLAAGLKVFPQLLRIPVMRILLVVTLGGFFFRHGLNDWLPEILRSGGMSATVAGFWAALPVMVGIVTVLVVAPVATPGRRIPMLVGFFLVSGASALVIGAATGAPLAIALMVEGVVSRAVSPVIMLILLDAPQIGSQRMGAAGGLYFSVGEVGGVLGPLFLGIVADLAGGFMGGLVMLAAVMVAMAALSVRLRFALRRPA